MDILSGKRYDVIDQGYDMDIPNANNLELHILVIYFLTLDKYFKISYTEDIQITNILECHMYGISKSQKLILECHMYGISKSQVFVSGIFYGPG